MPTTGKSLLQNLGSSLTGNIPKAILCVRQVTFQPNRTKEQEAEAIKETAQKAAALQKKLLDRASNALKGKSDTLRSLNKSNELAGSGFLAMEVQYNPSSIYLDTQAGRQIQYSGGNMGAEGSNQIVQVIQPVATTMSFQLIFDKVNPQDAFMLQNMNVTAGNAVSAAADIYTKAKGESYSVQSQVDGIMSLLTQSEARQVIFYWANMCFRGELVSVNSRYTMFNKDGDPIRGVVDISIRQGDEAAFRYDESYWNKAFDKAFGEATEDVASGMKSAFSQATGNNLLNLNL